MVPWEYSKQLRPNIALLYSQTGDTKDISVSHMLLSCITGRRLNKDKNEMLLCGNCCEYRNLKAAFVLSFCFFLSGVNSHILTIIGAVAYFEVRCGNEETAAAVVVQPYFQSYTALYVQAHIK